MTRKRMVKHLMSIGYSRNEANCFAVYIQVQKLKYEDWSEILNEILSNPDETIRRYNEMSEMNDRVLDLIRKMEPTFYDPYSCAVINFHFDFDLIARHWITLVLVKGLSKRT